MDNILTIKNLSCRVKGQRILEDVNMDFPAGKISAVFGDSGSGKTTLLKILSLLIREQPEFSISGVINFISKDRKIDLLKVKNDLWEIRRKIVYLSQVPNPLNMSILKNTEFPLVLKGEKNGKLMFEKSIQALKDVNLYEEVSERLNSSATGLSGGQKQKLCIARALTLDPEILLMDEPTSSLDTKNKEIIEDLIIDLGRKYTIIVVSHDKAQIRKVAEVYYQCAEKKIERTGI